MRASVLLRVAVAATLSKAALCASGQTFNVTRSNPGSGFAIGQSVFEVNGGFLVFGEQAPSYSDSADQDITVSFFDPVGQMVLDSVGTNPGFQSWGYHVSPVDQVSWSTGFVGAISSTERLDDDTDTINLCRLDEVGSIVWCVPVLIQDSAARAAFVLARNHRYYLAGTYNEPPYSDTLGAFVMRSDTAGNVEMIMRLARLNPVCADVDGLGNIYVAGTGLSPIEFALDATLMKLDSNGVEKWSRPLPESIGAFSDWYQVRNLSDGNLLCLGRWRFDLGPSSNGMLMAVYDTAGTMLWHRYGPQGTPLGLTSFFDTYQDTDTSFVACGTVTQTNWTRTLIYRFTLDGDSLWRRDYAHYGSSSLYPREALYSIEPTSDGGMVLTGETWQSILPNDHDLWLLKLDSMGCLVPGCQYVGINDLVFGLEDALTAYPNPSSGAFTLEFDLPENMDLAGDLRIQVFDMQGRQVLARALGLDRHQRITLDLSNEPAGLYSAHLSDGKRILTGVRLVVE